MSELFIPGGIGESDFVERKSRFISRSEKADSMESVKIFVKQLKDRYPKARHVVWACVIGKKGELKGLSDDGEPKGSGGNPVLKYIEGGNLTYTLVTVVRFFGGIKLGKGPLSAAYGRAAREALKKMPKIKFIETERYKIEMPFCFLKGMEMFFKEKGIVVLKKEFAPEPVIYVNVPLSILDDFFTGVADISHGKVMIKSVLKE